MNCLFGLIFILFLGYGMLLTSSLFFSILYKDWDMFVEAIKLPYTLLKNLFEMIFKQ